MNDRAPAGSAPDSTASSITRCASKAVAVAGLEITGIPASSATAPFSAIPHAGKLNALMCTATPARVTRTC
jgi:hypothetical protein